MCRVPLVDLPPIIPVIPSSGSEHGSQHEVKQTSSKKDREIRTPEGPTSEGEDHRSRLIVHFVIVQCMGTIYRPATESLATE